VAEGRRVLHAAGGEAMVGGSGGTGGCWRWHVVGERAGVDGGMWVGHLQFFRMETLCAAWGERRKQKWHYIFFNSSVVHVD
jgi:hypothetical protein